jgi:IclR family pca regulon transcriptional regulator
VRVARPHLAALAEDTGESATLTANSTPTTVEVVAQVDASRLVGITDWVGRRFPLHASAAGKLALAALPDDALEAYLAATPLAPITAHTITDRAAFRRHLAEVREQGYAASVDELEDGLTGLAVPVPAPAGTPLLTVATGCPSRRGDVDGRDELLAAVRACADRIGAAMA